ncbi:hypothetical protein K443DRAFT_166517 [Laccaria amethystina LaAM-08-1]|jgi:hypothetical protein|uniref:Uncharacterized protein n=1 Tax=Laccaria amethystina LaAM-08-1 TaxID=1095629 RepID=A0A0C9XRG0_9AGAR|nr:hypothetical protein K443DRAFT_166517 [Laccaria amethystina LaAM-08-1]
MAAKWATTLSTSATYTPPHISHTDKLLVSRITLPVHPCVTYARFEPQSKSHLTALPNHETIELARRFLLSRNAFKPLLDSMMFSAHSGTCPFIYVFMISQRNFVENTLQSLKELSFSGLTSEYFHTPFFLYI